MVPVLDRYESMILAVGLPVGLWAGFHMLQAWQDPILIVPAFGCGLILIGLLEVTKTPIAPIMSHGLYNTATVAIAITAALRSRAMPMSISWFPLSWTSGDVLLLGLAATWIALIVLPALFDVNAKKKK